MPAATVLNSSENRSVGVAPRSSDLNHVTGGRRMPNYKFSMKIDGVTVAKNGRSSDKRVDNRFLIQLVSPSGTEHPSTTFSFNSPDGEPVPTDILQKSLPFGLAFKLQDFSQVLTEPLRLRLHFFQDTRRDWFQQLTGRFIELAIKAILGGQSIIGVKVDKLLGLDESWKLSDKTYSQKLGSFELDLDPTQLEGDSPSQQEFVLTAPEKVQHLKFPKPGEKPKRFTVVKEGSETAKVTSTLVLQRSE